MMMMSMDRGSSSGVYDDVEEYLSFLLSNEDKHYPLCANYIAVAAATSTKNLCSTSEDRVCETWRRKICEWCYEVADHFEFDREVVSFALHYFDNVAALQAQTSITRSELQLIAVTSLFLAIKVHGESDLYQDKRKLRIDQFCQLSRGYFQPAVIEDMERRMLSQLQWKTSPPTTLRFINCFLKLCVGGDRNVVHGIYEVARYLCELALCKSKLALNHKTSTLACASILLAVHSFPRTLFLTTEVRENFFHRLAATTGLCYESEVVMSLQPELRCLAPDLFVSSELAADFCQNLGLVLVDNPQRVSPVSVMQLNDDYPQQASPADSAINDSPKLKRQRSGASP